MEDYKQKYELGSIVTAKRTCNGEIITGKFSGFHLLDKSNPKSIVGIVHTPNGSYDVEPNSIESVISKDESVRKELIHFLKNHMDSVYEEISDNNAVIAWLEKQGKQEQLYIRFGEIPTNEKSKIYQGEIEVGTENGVSVYPAFKTDEGDIVLGLNLPITKTTLYTQQHLIEYDDRPCYLVKGDYIGKDADGQSLINNVSIIERIDSYRVKEEKQGEQKRLPHPIKDYQGSFPCWNNAHDISRPKHLQRCICYDKYMNGVYCYVYDDIGKYWCTQMTEEHDLNGDNYVCDYADYRVTVWMPLPDTLLNVHDEVEPKFEIEKGKWYVCIKSRYTNFIVGKVYPSPKDGMLSSGTMSQYVAKHCFRLWSIKDAKDGDILVTPNNNIFIFKEVQNNCHIYAHCGLYFNRFCAKYSCVNGTLSVKLPDNYKPATKEQRELLFQKMKEVGYEWDAGKKKLKDVVKEQKPTEDNCKISDWDMKVDTIEYNNGYECGKQRVLKYPEDYGLCKKPACSEEHISVIEKDGEQWVRVCAIGEDFIIAAHDYKDGDKTKFMWNESCKIGTFSLKQGYIILALNDEINARLEEIGGEPLDSLYWSSSDYSSYYAWFVLFGSGSVDINGKCYSHMVRRVIAF